MKIMLPLILLLALTINYIFLKLALKYCYVDKPSTKLKIHKKPIPLSGGISIVASILLALTLSNLAGFIPLKDTLFYLLYLIFPAMMILFIGLLDDRGLVQAKTRITAQAIFSLIPITTLFINLKIDNILDFTTLALLAILFIVGTIAAVNMSDGMDGLCGGLLLVTFAGMIFVNKLPSLNCFLIIIIISLIGFLFYNFNPARVFLGNSGSEFLGFLIATISIYLFVLNPEPIKIFLIMVMIGLPLIDMTSSVIRRIKNKKDIMSGDRNHIYDQLLKNGYNQKQTWVIMMMFQIVVVTLSVFFFQYF
jgi:UDP-GlcNAc:undecaprenyl-phosphate GlcNAc-1-phosphate transferase